MKRASLLAAVLVISGCAANLRLERMQLELAQHVRHGEPAKIDELDARYTRLAASAYGEGSLEWTRARNELALLYSRWGLHDRALQISRTTVGLAERYGRKDQALPIALLDLAHVHLFAHQWTDAERIADRLLAFCEAVIEPKEEYTECDQARFDLDDVYLRAGAYAKFAHAYVRTDETANVALDRESGIHRATVLGRGYFRYGAYPEALWYFERCWSEARVAPATAAGSPRSVSSAPSGDVEILVMDSAHSFESQAPRCLEDLLELRRILGDAEEADRLAGIQRAMWARGPDLEKDLRERVRSTHAIWKNGYLTTHYANNLAFYLAGKGRHEDAIAAYRQAIAYIDDGFEKDGVFHGVYPVGELIDELVGLGESCEATARFADAVSAYERAVAVASAELHPKDGRRLETRAGFARTLAKAGRHEDSVTAWGVYLAEAEAMRGRDHADYALGLIGLADSLERTGKSKEARQSRERAQTIRDAYARTIAETRDLPLPVALRSAASPAN